MTQNEYKIKKKDFKKTTNKDFLKKQIDKKSSARRILFMPTNGVGLGHLTRTLAVARRLKKMYPNTEIIFFTTSFALNLIIEEGFFAYYFPSMDIGPVNVNQKEVDKAIEDQLISIIKRHNIDTLVFDGVFPYACLMNAIEKSSVNAIWIQRGMHKDGKSKIVCEREKYFNTIIVPGEANSNETLENNNKFKFCSPIIYANKKELLPRETIMKMWNLDPNKKTAYVSLGEGSYEDVNSLIFRVIEILKSKENLQIVLGESIIARRRYNIDPDIFILKNYPNSIYFNAFDFAIITGSYNIFHETIYFGVPTILLPTKMTGTDDQIARAKIAERLGTGFVFVDFDKDGIDKAISKLMDPDINDRMKKIARKVFKNGAKSAAKYIIESI